MNENEIILSIKEKLTQIEQRENIRILYACESGSRHGDLQALIARLKLVIQPAKRLSQGRRA